MRSPKEKHAAFEITRTILGNDGFLKIRRFVESQTQFEFNLLKTVSRVIQVTDSSQSNRFSRPRHTRCVSLLKDLRDRFDKRGPSIFANPIVPLNVRRVFSASAHVHTLINRRMCKALK